jgi:hypothetical protein
LRAPRAASKIAFSADSAYFEPMIIRMVCLLLVFSVVQFGCTPKSETKPETKSAPPQPSAYFKTQFQDESQFITETILSDIVEMAFYAKNKALPDSKQYSVEAVERHGSRIGAPVYDVQIKLPQQRTPLKFELSVNAIWSPAAYAPATDSIFKALELNQSGKGESKDDHALLADLMDAKAVTLEKHNIALSRELERDFANAALHEKAALLSGVFAYRENSGQFYDTRLPMCRATAHLAFADACAGHGSRTLCGQFAEALLESDYGASRSAVEKLKKIDTHDPVAASWVAWMVAENTGDYRPLEKIKTPTPLERIAWYKCYSGRANLNDAFKKLTTADFEYPDFCRVANSEDFSVEMGHELLRLSLPLEYQEMNAVYGLSHGHEPAEGDFVKELNQTPERCFTIGTNGSPVVRVIGWGQWAMFFQRHLCHAASQNYRFMKNLWGVPDEAKQFSETTLKAFLGLRLFPFLSKEICEDEVSYRKAVADGVEVTVDTPHLVPAYAWNLLGWKRKNWPLYEATPNLHINEWHKHNPPPGTAYDFPARSFHPSLVNGAGVVPRLQKLHDISPWDLQITCWLIDKKYGTNVSEAQLMELYQPVLDYSVDAAVCLANASTNNPARYEEFMMKAAAMHPAFNWQLSRHFWNLTNDVKAAEFADKAFELDPNRVRAANCANWLMRYHLGKGETNRAQEIADYCGEVYSFDGLLTQADFYEITSNFSKAFQCYENLEKRYNNSMPMLKYCLRVREVSGEKRWTDETEKRLNALFPNGLEDVSIKDLKNAPTDGTIINDDNDLLRQAKLKKGDIIVATYGVRVHNLLQYTYTRRMKETPLELIVWKNDHYEEVQANPPEHRFKADFRDYTVQKKKAKTR